MVTRADALNRSFTVCFQRLYFSVPVMVNIRGVRNQNCKVFYYRSSELSTATVKHRVINLKFATSKTLLNSLKKNDGLP